MWTMRHRAPLKLQRKQVYMQPGLSQISWHNLYPIWEALPGNSKPIFASIFKQKILMSKKKTGEKHGVSIWGKRHKNKPATLNTGSLGQSFCVKNYKQTKKPTKQPNPGHSEMTAWFEYIWRFPSSGCCGVGSAHFGNGTCRFRQPRQGDHTNSGIIYSLNPQGAGEAPANVSRALLWKYLAVISLNGFFRLYHMQIHFFLPWNGG